MPQNNLDILYRRALNENARLTNELNRARQYSALLEEENEKIVIENDKKDTSIQELLCQNAAKDELIRTLQQQEAENLAHISELEKDLKEVGEILRVAKETEFDLQSVINIMRNRQFNTNSDATRFMNGQIDILDPTLNTIGLEDLAGALQRKLNEAIKEVDGDSPKPSPNPKKIHSSVPSAKVKQSVKITRPRHCYAKNDITRMGIDTSNLPEGAKIIHRRDSKTGEDVWELWTLGVSPASIQGKKYVIGRFNVPGDDPMCSKKPETFVYGCPLLPSFIRFYLVSKFELNMSEQSILKMFKEMQADIPQSTLNKWMHKVLKKMRDCLDGPLKDRLRQSTYTQNDETRLSVRSKDDKTGRYSYHTEYVHAMLSPEKKLVYMTYDEGSRSHKVQKEIIEGSNIHTITCDRAAIYVTLEKCFEEYGLIRSSCWFHGRHNLADAYLTDHRMGPAIGIMNGLFRIERLIAGRTAAERYEMRQKYSKPLVDKLMTLFRKYRLNSQKYGGAVMKAVNYILDDEVSFRRFLDDGHIEMHNIAAERMFRHIAMGRRIWMHVGSHDAAENISFIYSILESCKLNDISFGDYIEDVCTRIMQGDSNYESMLPCDYKPQKSDATTKAVA